MNQNKDRIMTKSKITLTGLQFQTIGKIRKVAKALDVITYDARLLPVDVSLRYEHDTGDPLR